MRSKTSYFNSTLFKKNLTRFWPLWGGASALGVLVPLALLVELLDEGFRSQAGNGLEITLGYYAALSYIVPIISLVYAALCALAVWHYLYNTRSVGLFHSLPITRKGLFVTNFLSGMAMMLIPYAVTGGVTILITLAAGLFEPVGVLVAILGVIGESFFYFTSATLVIFITGNAFAFVAFYFIFHFLAVGAEWLVGELVSEFYFGVNQTYEGIVSFLCPTYYLESNLSVWPVYQQITTPDGWIEHGALESATLQNGWLIAVYALVGAVLLAAAWALYRRRRSESAGDVVAVGWMKPIFRYGVALCAALAGGVLLYNLFVAVFSGSETAWTIPMIVCMALAGIVGYYIASMLLAKSLRIFRGSGKGALATVIAAAAICMLIAADPFGVETWVPGAEGIEQAGISIYGNAYSNMGGYLDVDVSDGAAIQKLLDLHRTILSEKEQLNNRDSDAWRLGNSAQVHLSYWVNGKRTDRSYPLLIPAGGQAPLESLNKAEILATDPAIQEANIFEQILWDDIMDSRIIHGYLGDVYNRETHEINGVDLTPEEAQALEAAVRRDIQAGHFGKTLFVPEGEERDGLVYYGTIQLDYNVTRKPNPNRFYSGEDVRTINFEISTYCTETLAALKDLGILRHPFQLLTREEYHALRDAEKSGASFPDSYDSYYGGGFFPAETVPAASASVSPESAAVYPEEAF